MSTIEDFLYSIKKAEGLKFDGEVAKFMNIDRRSLATAKGRKVIPVKYVHWYCRHYEIKRVDFEKHIAGNTHKVTEPKGGQEMNYVVEAQKETISLQKEKIERLEERINQHKSTPVQQTIWSNIDYDYECEVKLTFENFTMGRTILSITNKEIQSKVLGYSVSEIEKLWDIGTLYKKSNQHPIDTTLHKSTIKNIAKQIKSLPTLFESLKNMMGNHYIPQPLTYVCKDKSFVNAIAYNKVNWRDKTVSSKIKFLLDE